ncbi:MAG: glycosyltransferase family 4 protein [Chloroflexi bacterium]|nr:glycosyltransferase family 4 protein [Chloroflexota bacterium]
MKSGRQPSVLMIGPLLHHYGGVSAVTSLLVDSALTKRVRLRYVASANKYGVPRKVSRFSRACLQTWALLRGREAPDIVHLHASAGPSFYRKAILAAMARHFHKRVVFQIHSGRFVAFYRHGSAALQRLITDTLDRSAAVVVLARVWQEQIGRLTSNRHVVVLPNPVDCDVFAGTGAVRQTGTLLFMGDLAAHKGVFDLLDAVPLIAAQHAGTRLVLCGRGDRRAVWNHAHALGMADRIVCPGYVTGREKVARFQEATLYVHPAHYEALGVSLLEALAAGRPVVATAVGGIPEVVESGGNGLLVPPGNAEALAGAILRLLDDPELCGQMAHRNRLRARAEFDLPLVVEQLAELYGEE